MNIFLYQNGRQTGPFTEEQIVQMLQASIITSDALGWKEGMVGWERLTTFIPMPYNLAPPPPRNSWFGISSFVFGLLSLLTWIALVLVTGILASRNGGAAPETLNIILGLFLFGSVIFNSIGVVFGLISYFKGSSKSLSMIGACLNGLVLISLAGLMCLGMMVRHAHS